MKRTLVWAAFVAYLILLGYLVWNPEPTVPSSAVTRVTSLLHGLGIGVAVPTVEFGLNVLLFTPMGLLGMVAMPRLRVADVVLIGFVASFVIEVVQKYFLPARAADTRDIVSNTTGALVGAVVVWIVRRVRAWWRVRADRASARSPASPHPARSQETAP